MKKELNQEALQFFRGLPEALYGISYEDLREQAIKEGNVKTAEEFDEKFEEGIEDEPAYQVLRRLSILKVMK